MQYTWQSFDKDIEILSRKVLQIPDMKNIYGIPRGGMIVAVALSNRTELPLIDDERKISQRTVIVDDIVDSGKTMKKLLRVPELYTTASLFKGNKSEFEPTLYLNIKRKEWVIMPWEQNSNARKDEQEYKQRM